MKKICSYTLLFIGLLCFCTSCGNFAPEIAQNRENIKKLRAGMSKQQVKKIMGEPLVNEIYNKPNIWFYYTDCKWSDGAITRDECTPLIFENGKLKGWGWEFYNKRYLAP